jgi:ADP-ribosylglycohydrolase
MKSESNGCLMRITPQAVWGYKLTPNELYEAVKLQTLFTHSNPVAISASYLYCYAIGKLIKGKDSATVYQETWDEAKRLGKDHEERDISSWFGQIEL